MRIVESHVVVRNSSSFLKAVFAGYRILGSLPPHYSNLKIMFYSTVSWFALFLTRSLPLFLTLQELSFPQSTSNFFFHVSCNVPWCIVLFVLLVFGVH